MCSVGLEEHCDAVSKLQHSNRASAKLGRTQLREIALMLAWRHLHSDPVDPVACVHRDDGDVEFMNIVANQLAVEVCGHMHIIAHSTPMSDYRECL